LASVDQGISYSYLKASHDMLRNQYAQSIELANLELTGLPVEEALSRIGKDVYGFDPFVKEGCIWAGQVCVELLDGKVSRLKPDPG